MGNVGTSAFVIKGRDILFLSIKKGQHFPQTIWKANTKKLDIVWILSTFFQVILYSDAPVTHSGVQVVSKSCLSELLSV